jgi:hypothetical protein
MQDKKYQDIDTTMQDTIETENELRYIRKDFFKIGGLQLKAYDSIEFAQVFESHTSIPLIEKLANFPELLSVLQETCVDQTTFEEIAPVEMKIEILNEWAVLFDKMFFFNSILKRTGPLVFRTTLLAEEEDPEAAEEGPATSNFDDLNTQKIYINILSFPHLASEKTDYSRSFDGIFWPLTTTHWIVIVLKEMLHAFNYFYSNRKRPASEGGEGINDHGPAWADCTVILENWLQGAVNWEVAVDISDSIRVSMKVDDWVPTPEQTMRWGLVRVEMSGGKVLVLSKGSRAQFLARFCDRCETDPEFFGQSIISIHGF